jgi:hypothetical protein
MRSTIALRAAVASSIVVVLQLSVLARASTLRVFMNIGEYFGTVYVQSSRQGVDHVLLRGQPLTATIRIVNAGTPALIRIRDNQSAPFSVQLIPAGSDRSVAEGRILPVPISGRKGESPLPRRLGRSEELLWHVSVPDFERVPPGVYRLTARTLIVDAAGSPPAVNNDSIVVELRDVVSLADRVEAARVAATRAMSRQDYATADTLARGLIEIYPQSAFGYFLVGDAALHRRDSASARRAYLKALELLRSRADTLYAAVATEHSLVSTIEALEAKIRWLD